MAKVRVKVRFAGGGAFVQLLGVGVALLGATLLGMTGLVVGCFIGIALFLIGSQMSKYSCCSECGNRVDGGHVKICPVCRAAFDGTVSVSPQALPAANSWRDALIFFGGAIALCGVLIAYRLLAN